MEEMTDKSLKSKEHDPFPALTFARRFRWGIVDRWAAQHMERLGVPNPWHAYQMGVQHGEMKARKQLPPPVATERPS